MTTEEDSNSPPASRHVDRAGIVIAVVLAALAAVLVWDASQLQATTMYGMGPQAMPIVVAAGLGLLAIGNLIDALRGNLPPRESSDPKAGAADPRRTGASDRNHRLRRRLHPRDVGAVRHHLGRVRTARRSSPTPSSRL